MTIKHIYLQNYHHTDEYRHLMFVICIIKIITENSPGFPPIFWVIIV